jgi:hypothetical protein
MSDGELSTTHHTNNLIPSATQLDNPARKGMADIAHLLQYLLAGSVVPASGIVMGGLTVAGKAGDMRVDVHAGFGGLYNGATPEPQHPLGVVVVREDDVSPALNDGDGTHDRIDVISITPSSALLDEEPVLEIGGGTTDTPTRRGPAYTIVVTEGVPATPPVAPGTPTGSLKLYEVLVPSGLTAGGGGTAVATLTDYRNLAGAYIKGPDAAFNGWVQAFNDWTIAGVSSLLQAFGVQDADGKFLGIGIDRVKHWPAVVRAGIPTGDEGGNLYPMMIADDRAHWVSAAFKSGSASTADASVTAIGFYPAANFDGVEILHLNAAANVKSASCEFETPARGASFDAYRVRYKVVTAAPASIVAQAFAYDASTDTVIPLSDATAVTAAVGSYDLPLDNPVEFVPDNGDIVAIVLTPTFAAAADSAKVLARVGMAAVTEGRNP